MTWRPAISDSGTSNLFSVVATEAGWRTNLEPRADTFGRDGGYADSNYGADPVLTVKRDPTMGFSREVFLRFVLPSFRGRWQMRGPQLTPVAVSQPGTHAVALVADDTWEKSTLTWNTKPASGPALATWLPQTGVPVQFSAAEAIQQDLPANGLLSLRIYATNSTADGKVDYASKEAGPPRARN